VEAKLQRIQMANEDDFFEPLQDILSSLDQQELNGVFQAWVRRVHEASQGNANDVR
jgi:hypothetical protein